MSGPFLPPVHSAFSCLSLPRIPPLFFGHERRWVTTTYLLIPSPLFGIDAFCVIHLPCLGSIVDSHATFPCLTLECQSWLEALTKEALVAKVQQNSYLKRTSRGEEIHLPLLFFQVVIPSSTENKKKTLEGGIIIEVCLFISFFFRFAAEH